MNYKTFNQPSNAEEQMDLPLSRQRGATVIELVLYLAGAVILLVAVFSLFGSGTVAARTRTESSNVQNLIANINRVYGTSRDYPTGNGIAAALVSADAVPANMKNGNSAVLRNQFGGDVLIGSADGVSFFIGSGNMPKAACVELAQLPVNPQTVTINGGVALPAPVTAQQAVSGCTMTANTVQWTFR